MASASEAELVIDAIATSKMVIEPVDRSCWSRGLSDP
jgi:hypothetical protein